MKVLLANPPCRIDLDNRYERAFVRAGSHRDFLTSVRKGVPFIFYLVRDR